MRFVDARSARAAAILAAFAAAAAVAHTSIGSSARRFDLAQNRSFGALTFAREGSWNGAYDFVALADPQLGMLHGGPDSRNDAPWDEELALLQLAVSRVNALRPRPRFLLVSGDLINRFPEPNDEARALRERQAASFRSALAKLDPSIELVLQPGNHDIGDTPTAATLADWFGWFGDDFYSFWVGGVLYIAIDSQYYAKAKPGAAADDDRRGAEMHSWLLGQLRSAAAASAAHVVMLSHIPPFLGAEAERWGWATWEPAARREVLAAAAAAGVKLWVSGHVHAVATTASEAGVEVVTTATGTTIHWTCPLGEVVTQDKPDFANCVGRPPLVANASLAGLRVFSVRRRAIRHHWVALESGAGGPSEGDDERGLTVALLALAALAIAAAAAIYCRRRRPARLVKLAEPAPRL